VKVIQSSCPGPDCLTSELIREADQDISLGHFPGKYGGKYRGLRTGFAHVGFVNSVGCVDLADFQGD
jgi:hypothetical protein